MSRLGERLGPAGASRNAPPGRLPTGNTADCQSALPGCGRFLGWRNILPDALICLDEARFALIAEVFALIGGMGRTFSAGGMGGANPERCSGLVWGRAVGAQDGGLVFQRMP